jgi:hypothetical protein
MMPFVTTPDPRNAQMDLKKGRYWLEIRIQDKKTTGLVARCLAQKGPFSVILSRFF